MPGILAGIASLKAELSNAESAKLPDAAGAVLSQIIEDAINGFCMVAERPGGEGGPAALIVGTFVPSVRLGRPYLFVQDFWVAPDARAAGLGERFMNEVKAELLRLGVDRLEGIYPRPEYERIEDARRFYERLGADPIGLYVRIPCN